MSKVTIFGIFIAFLFFTAMPAMALSEEKVKNNESSAPVGGAINVSKKMVKAGEELVYTIEYQNYSKNTVSDILFKVTLPENVFSISSQESSFTLEEGYLVYRKETLEPKEKEILTIPAQVSNSFTNKKELTTYMAINYQNPKTNTALSDEAQVSVTVEPEQMVAGSEKEDAMPVVSMLFAGAGVPFFPNSLVEWLILFLVLVILVLIIRQLYALYDEKKKQKQARVEAENHMQQVRDRMNENLGDQAPRANEGSGYGVAPVNPLPGQGSYGSSQRMNYYGQNGYGPNGQPVYGPARGDLQGNGFNVPGAYSQQKPQDPKVAAQGNVSSAHSFGGDARNADPKTPQAQPQHPFNPNFQSPQMPMMMPPFMPMPMYGFGMPFNPYAQMQQMQQMYGMYGQSYPYGQNYQDPSQAYYFPPQPMPFPGNMPAGPHVPQPPHALNGKPEEGNINTHDAQGKRDQYGVPYQQNENNRYGNPFGGGDLPR